MGLPEQIHTDRDLERAETKGRVIGWLQGGIAVFVGGMILNVVGWIPTAVIVAVVGYAAYKVLSKPSSES